ncbi:MAG: Ig-like domain-containing protein, partial [Gemmatimonadota bacterium]|nr:Ig-like domain-containing protein [Gemmatimonadota bacterium]
MNVARTRRFVTTAALLFVLPPIVSVVAVAPLGAQAAAPVAKPVARLVAEPARVTIRAGDSQPFTVTAYDAAGAVIPDAVVRVGGPRQAVAFADGRVQAFRAGSFTATATAAGANGPITLDIAVLVTWPALSKIAILADSGRLYTGISIGHKAEGAHADGTSRPGLIPTWRSSTPTVATVDRFGTVTALKAGTVVISAEAEGVVSRKSYTIATNPVSSIALDIKEDVILTGQVVRLNATARTASGAPVKDAVITWSYVYTPDDTTVAPGGPGIIDWGRFTPNYPGRFTLLAQSGNVTARKVLEAKPRDVVRRITVTGRGNIATTATSDLWPWTGKDGRDYCLVGTWGGDGYGMVFDITDMNNIVKTDSIKIDARTINDVTVSPDGRYGVLAREGASNRVNGVVILDLANPAHPKIASTFDQELTGGVHNMFATNDHLFAISGGQKYVIIDVKDIYKPKYVSEYQHPNARIHDLWVRDGIAYSAQGGVGAVMVDVGNGKYGGTIEK